MWWVKFRFDFWLDIYGVPRRRRRDLRSELVGNLADAAREVGLSRALVGVGGLRRLAFESSRGPRRSAWSAGVSAALLTAALVLMAFFAVSLYYAEGVVDSGVSQPVASGLFPFVGSSVEVQHAPGAGLSLSIAPGLLPVVLALVVFVLVARPWRSWRRRRPSDRVSSA
jgi:hypothetical protein